MIVAIDTDRLARNTVLTVIARLAMIAATAMLPVAGFLLTRTVNSIDAMSLEVSKGATQIKLLEQAVKFGFDANKADVASIRQQLTDHEGRLRVIERDFSRTVRQ